MLNGPLSNEITVSWGGVVQ